MKSNRFFTSWTLPIFVTLASLLYFGGNIGLFNDDYFYDQHDVVTGRVRSYVLDRPYHVWRPLYRVLVPALITSLREHSAILHTMQIALHCSVAVTVFVFLRHCRLRVAASAAAALWFTVYPAHFEAYLWQSAFPTPLGCLIVLWTAIWQRKWLQTSTNKLNLLMRTTPLVAAAAAFAVASLNEQPAGAIAALPFVALTFKRTGQRGTLILSRKALIPTLYSVAALVIYLQMAKHHMAAPPVQHGIGQAVQSSLDNLIAIARQVPMELALQDFATGALSHGLITLRENQLRTALLVGVGLVLIITRLIKRTSSGIKLAEEANLGAENAPFGVFFFGLVWFFAAWVPVIVTHSLTSPRLHYPPNIGIALMLGAMIEIMLRSSFGSRVFTRASASFMGFSYLVLCCVMLVGVQDGYRQRFSRDMTEAKQLAALFATTARPGSVFLPLRVESSVLETGSRRFDEYFTPCWGASWAAGWHLQQVFKRTDVHIVLCGRKPQQVWSVAGNLGSGIIIRQPIAQPKPDTLLAFAPRKQGRLVPFERMIPFMIDRAGRVCVVSSIRVYDESTELLVQLPQVPQTHSQSKTACHADVGPVLAEDVQ